jgi:hypothetical protein
VNRSTHHLYFSLIVLCVGFLLMAAPATAQLGGLGLGNPVGSSPLNGGATRNGIGNSRLQISNGISNGTISLQPNAPAPAPGIGITAPTVSTFGAPGGGPGNGGGNPPGGGYFAAPIDGGIMILIVLGIGLMLQMGLKEARKRQ